MQKRKKIEERDRVDFRYDSYCGLYCGACDVIAANEKGCVERLAEEWHRKIEDLKCAGCKTETVAVFCQTCEMRRCARERNLEFCYECVEFPCPRLLAFRNDGNAHHSIIKKNLEAIRQKGAQVWLCEQRKRWSCKDCGKRFFWYDSVCKGCGAELFNCKKEEKATDEP